MDPLTLFGNLWAVALIFGAYSLILAKQTSFSEWASYSFIAFAMSMRFVYSVEKLKNSAITPLLGGDIVVLIPIILSLMLFTRYSSRYRFISRFPMAILVGVGASLSLRGGLETSIMNQLIATIKPINFTNIGLAFENLLVVTTVASVLIYFTFSREKKGTMLYIGKYARYMMMVNFGAFYGNAIMGQLSRNISQVKFLLDFFMKILGMA